MAIGLLLLAFTSKDIPWLFLPGLAACSVAGVSFLTASMQISLLLKRGSKIYIGLINGAFDSSIITMLILKELVAVGVKILYVFICLTTLMIIISVIVTLLQTREEELYSYREQEIQSLKQPERELTLTNITVIILYVLLTAFSKCFKNYCYYHLTAADGIQNGSEPEKTKSSATSNLPSLKSLLLSGSFFLNSLWFSVFTLQWILYLGSVNSQLEKVLKDDRKVNDFTNMLGYILFLGIVTSFLSGGFQEWQKYIFKDSSTPSKRKYLHLISSFTIVNLLGVILSVLGLVQSEHTFYAEFCVIPFFRSFLFSVNMNWIVAIFPQKYTGLVYGILMTMYGLFSLLQYPFFNWIQAYDSAFSHVNYMFLCLSTITLMHPMYILYQGLSGQDSIDSKEKVSSNTFTDSDFQGTDNPTFFDNGERMKESETTKL